MSIVVPLQPETSGELITVHAPLRHLCPFVDEIDNGTVTVEFRVTTTTFEAHALAAYFAEFADTRISHEALTDRIFTELNAHDGPTVTRVSSEWTTAGMNIRVERS
ncbi:hypothetical protein ACFPPE_06875 [Agromyces tardus]|uniref:hypothetical protein n=1 Tax=Agromyces tardus TaxID=2583849 RepID=UPI0036125C01